MPNCKKPERKVDVRSFSNAIAGRFVLSTLVPACLAMTLLGLSVALVWQPPGDPARIALLVGLASVSIAVFGRACGSLRRRASRDATAREGGKREELLATLNGALNSMPHGVALYDQDQRIVLANRGYAEMYGLTTSDVAPGATMKEILEKRAQNGTYLGEDPERYISERLTAMEHPTVEQTVERFSDGRIIRKSRNPMPDGGWLSVHEDITERQSTEDQIAYLAHNDVLTGLFNRTVLQERIETALAHSRRSGREFAIFLIDLDNFKLVNDQFGHLVGDRLLQAVASRLLASVREVDTVARIGGDEFAILLDCEEGARDSADGLARRLMESMQDEIELDGLTIQAHASIGVALAPSDGTDSATLQRNADLALYQAKEAGRDCVRFFNPEMDTALRLERALEFDMRQALMTDEFELFYQAVVNVKTLRTSSMEALVRWRHPRLGMVPPDRFIKIAEKTGLINLLGEWVLNTACEEAAKWPSHISVAVNLSPAQFKSGNIVEIVRAALEMSGLPANRLTLEITESTLLERTDENLAILERLRALGSRIALDDFGTGYSSLSVCPERSCWIA